MRVVSLLPSATEIVYALGLEPVGVSHECDHPPAAREVTSVVRSRVDGSGSGAEIDAAVQDAVESGGVYELDREALAELDPDLVVSQGICDVCAVDSALVKEAVADLGLDCEILATDPHRLDDVFADIRRVGATVGCEDRADEVVAKLRARVDRVAETADGVPDGERPRVAVLDWLDPVMVAGHWIPELVEIAGGRYGLTEPGDRSEPCEWAKIREYDPEVLIAAPCGFELDQTTEHLSDLADRPGYDGLTAVRDGRAVAMDGHHYVNRPGPRLVDTLEFLAGVLHPDRFDTPPTDAVRPLAPTPA